MKRMMKTNPSLRHIKLERTIPLPTKFNHIERRLGELSSIQPIFRKCADHEYMMHDSADGADEFRTRRACERLSENLDYTTQAEGDIKHTYPCVGLVFDMCFHGALVRIQTHE